MLRIPVVVHNIRSGGGTGNLSDTQIRSQITVLNEDFRAIPGTSGAPGADTNIEFFLADTDPNGNPTTGIVRYSNTTWFNDNGQYYNSIAWDTTRYLNIYTNNAGGGGVLGYVPALPHQGTALNTNADRVVILYTAFGRPSSLSPYNLGRTTTHEVGHYLGLFHTFNGGCGSASACYQSGDRICDTNQEANPRFSCSSASSCGSSDPISNYMDYTNDACMNQFTLEQGRRMRCTLTHFRPNLAQPSGPVASSTRRDGAGNLNGNYACTAPVLGSNMTANIVTFGTPYTLAAVYGYTSEATTPFESYTILIDTSSAFVLGLPFTVPSAGVVAQWIVPIPNDPTFAGLPMKTQGLLLGSGFALTNAMDLVVGG